jgi:glycosyltransferase involved in cell wall biosynthesis
MYHANLLSALVGTVAGARSIYWNIRRTGFYEDTLPNSTRAVARVAAWLSHFVPEKIIYCAQSAAEWHARFGYDSHRAIVIQNGVDTERFSPSTSARQALREKLGIGPTALLIGSVARFHPDKDHPTMFAAIKRVIGEHPGMKCLLVGTGTEPNGPLADLARTEGMTDHLLFLGPRSDLPAIMNALDLHVTSSVTEGFPNVIAEATACGTPCVSTDVGDAALVIGQHGWLVPIKSPAILAAAIVDALALRDSSAWISRREAVRAYCEANFAIGRMVDSYEKAWAAAGQRQRPL